MIGIGAGLAPFTTLPSEGTNPAAGPSPQDPSGRDRSRPGPAGPKSAASSPREAMKKLLLIFQSSPYPRPTPVGKQNMLRRMDQ